MESDLIHRAKGGDLQALNELVDNHKELAYNLALKIIVDPEDAKDVTQDSFLKALDNLHKFRQESKFSTWLFRIVYNESMMFVRKRPKIATMSDDLPLELADDQEEQQDHSTMRFQLNEAIKTLNTKESTIINLFYLAEKSVNEIHEITGMSTSNVKVLLHRTREKLKKQVENG